VDKRGTVTKIPQKIPIRTYEEAIDGKPTTMEITFVRGETRKQKKKRTV